MENKDSSPFEPDPRWWSHYCPEEGGWIQNPRGEPCNWCDTRETEALRD